jgi:hypothetical protein
MVDGEGSIFTEADGRKLAGDMFREISQWWDEPIADTVLDQDIPKVMGAREPDILRRYLAAVQSAGSKDLERGFMWAISDFIGTSLNAGEPNIERYGDEDAHHHGA